MYRNIGSRNCANACAYFPTDDTGENPQDGKLYDQPQTCGVHLLGLPIVYIEEPVDGQIDAQRHGHLRRVVRRDHFVQRRQYRYHVGDVDQLVVLCPEPV